MKHHPISAQQAAVLEAMAHGALICVQDGHGDAPRDVRLCVEGEFFGRRLTDAVQMVTVNGLELRGLIRNITPIEKRAYGRWEYGITARGQRELGEYQESFRMAKAQNAIERQAAHGR